MSILLRNNIPDPFALDFWNPFELLTSALQSPISGYAAAAAAAANTPIDWKETPAAHVFKADLPGVHKDDVKVEVEDGRVLQIAGERRRDPPEAEEQNVRWHRVERGAGKFLRRFRLPENVKEEGVRAFMENGVLTVVVPKEEVKKPEVKTVEISGGCC